MSLELISMNELLRDPTYRAYFLKAPALPSHYGPERLPWKLLVLKQGETVWRSKRFGTYQEAFEGFKRMRPHISNAAINCPSLDFMPPIRTFRVKGKTVKVGNKVMPLMKSRVWTPQLTYDMADHNWCPYCRRPSIFRMALPAKRSVGGFIIEPIPAIRCIICGASESIVNLRQPEKAQSWDSNRPKVYY